MNALRCILAIFGLLLSTLLVLSCSSNDKKVNIPYKILGTEDSKYNCSDGPLISLTVKVKVDPSVPKPTLDKLLNQIAQEQQGKTTRYGTPQLYYVQAFSDEKAESQIGYASVSTLPVKVPSEAELARQQEVGKFAGELIDAGKKIQNR